MNALDIVKPYLDRPTDTPRDFDEGARQVPASALAGGLADTFRSDKTLPMQNMLPTRTPHQPGRTPVIPARSP